MAFGTVAPAFEEAKEEKKESKKDEPALKEFLEGLVEIDGDKVTVVAGRPKNDRKCEWDEGISEDAWKPLVGKNKKGETVHYDAVVAKNGILDWYKNTRTMYVVKTKHEIQIWSIG